MKLFRFQQIFCCLLIFLGGSNDCGWFIDYYEFTDETFEELGLLMSSNDFAGAANLFFTGKSAKIQGTRRYNPSFWITNTDPINVNADRDATGGQISGITSSLRGLQSICGDLDQSLQSTSFGVVWQSLVGATSLAGAKKFSQDILGVIAREFIGNYYVLMTVNGAPQNKHSASNAIWVASRTNRPVHICILAWSKNGPMAVFYFFVGGFTVENLEGLQIAGLTSMSQVISSITESKFETRIENAVSNQPDRHKLLKRFQKNEKSEMYIGLLKQLLYFDTPASDFCVEIGFKKTSGFEVEKQSFQPVRQHTYITVADIRRNPNVLSKKKRITVDITHSSGGVGILQFQGLCRGAFSSNGPGINQVIHYKLYKNEPVAYATESCIGTMVKRPASINDNHIAHVRCSGASVESPPANIIGTHRKCVAGIERGAPSKRNCRAKAMDKGHAYYGFVPDTSKCFTSPTCDEVQLQTADDWRIYVVGGGCINPAPLAGGKRVCPGMVSYVKAVDMCERVVSSQLASSEIGDFLWDLPLDSTECCVGNHVQLISKRKGQDPCFHNMQNIWVKGVEYFDDSNVDSLDINENVWSRNFFFASPEADYMGAIQFFRTNGDLLRKNGLDEDIKYELAVDTAQRVVVDFSPEGDCNVCSIKVELSGLTDIVAPIVYEEEYVCGKYMGIFVEMKVKDEVFKDFAVGRNINFISLGAPYPTFGLGEFQDVEDIQYTFKGTVCAVNPSRKCYPFLYFQGSFQLVEPFAKVGVCAVNLGPAGKPMRCSQDLQAPPSVNFGMEETEVNLVYQMGESREFELSLAWTCGHDSHPDQLQRQLKVFGPYPPIVFRVIPRECWSSGVDFTSITPSQRIFKFGAEISIPLHFYHRDLAIEEYAGNQATKLKCSSVDDFIVFSRCQYKLKVSTSTVIMYSGFAGLRFEDNPTLRSTQVTCKMLNAPWEDGFEKIITIVPDDTNLGGSTYSKRCFVGFNTAIFGFGVFDEHILHGAPFSWSVPQKNNPGVFTILQSKMGYPLHVQAKAAECGYTTEVPACIIGVIVQYGRTLVSVSSDGHSFTEKRTSVNDANVNDLMLFNNKGCLEIVGADLVSVSICYSGAFLSVQVKLPYTTIVSDATFEPIGCAHLKSVATEKVVFDTPSLVFFQNSIPTEYLRGIRNPRFCGNDRKKRILSTVDLELSDLRVLPQKPVTEFQWVLRYDKTDLSEDDTITLETAPFLKMFMSQQNLFDITAPSRTWVPQDNGRSLLVNSVTGLKNVLFRNPTFKFMKKVYQYFLYHLLLSMFDRKTSWNGNVIPGWVSSSLRDFLRNNQNFCNGIPPSHGNGCPPTGAPVWKCTDPWPTSGMSKGSCKTNSISSFVNRSIAFKTCAITPNCMGVHLLAEKNPLTQDPRTDPSLKVVSSGISYNLCKDLDIPSRSASLDTKNIDVVIHRPLVTCKEDCNIFSRSFGVSKISGHAMMCAFGRCAYFSNSGSRGVYNGFSWVGLPVGNQNPVALKGWSNGPSKTAFFGFTADCTVVRSSNKGQSWSTSVLLPVFTAHTPISNGSFSQPLPHVSNHTLVPIFVLPTKPVPSTIPLNPINGRGSDIWWLTEQEICLSTLINGHAVTCCTVWKCDCLDWNAWLSVFRIPLS